MFKLSRALALFCFALSLALLAVARPGASPPDCTTTSFPPPTTTVTVTAPAPTPTGTDQCNTGNIQCCDSVTQSSSPVGSLILGLLGIVVDLIDGVDVLLGLGCNAIVVVGAGESPQCAATPVCCENNSVGGLISIGCIVIIL